MPKRDPRLSADAAWDALRKEDLGAQAPDINQIWEMAGDRNEAVSEADSEAAREALTDYDFMALTTLEIIVATEDKHTPEYQEAQAALIRRSKQEYTPGDSKGATYRATLEQ